MMKYFLLVCLIFLTESTFSQVDKKQLDNLWISVDLTDSRFNSTYNDHYTRIIKFANSQMTMMNFGMANDPPSPFSIDKHNHIISEKLGNTRIVKLSEDSLILESDEVYRYKFVPFPPIKTQRIARSVSELLTQNGWIFQIKGLDELFILEFLDFNADQSLTRLGSDVLSLEHFYIDDSYFQHSDGFWTVKTIDETIVLSYQGVYDTNINTTLLINEITENSISGISWLQGREHQVSLVQQKNLLSSQLKEYTNLLTSATWKLESYEIPEQLLARSGGFPEAHKIDFSLRIDSSDFVNHRITYKFNMDHTYEKFKGNKTAFTGTWEFSKSGKFLKVMERDLSEEFQPKIEKFIQLIRLEAGKLDLLSQEELYVDDFSTHNYYIKQYFNLISDEE